MSRIAKILIYHDNYTAMAAEQFDFGSIYVPLLDYIKSNITTRLLTDTLKAFHLHLLMPNITIKLNNVDGWDRQKDIKEN